MSPSTCEINICVGVERVAQRTTRECYWELIHGKTSALAQLRLSRLGMRGFRQDLTVSAGW